MFEAVQFVETKHSPQAVETVLGQFSDEQAAVDSARDAKEAFRASGSDDYAWWIVRRKSARLANFICDSTNDKEFVLDLSSGELVEIPQ